MRFLAIGSASAAGPANARSVIDVDVATGSIVASRSLSSNSGQDYLGFSALSNNGSLLALAEPLAGAGPGQPTRILLWDVDHDREAFRLPDIPGGPPRRIAFSPDDRMLAVGFADGSIELWDLASRKRRWATPAHQRGYAPVDLSFSADGSSLASTGTVFQLKTFSIEFARAIVAHYVSGPDNQEPIELVLLETSTGRRIRSSIRNGLAAFSPNGRTLATSHNDGSIRLYDLPKSP